MPVERHRSPVAITTVPRASTAPAYHKKIDTILKDLKTCSRRLKTALDSFMDELRVLERLYYKNKNQHRMSLFFKRVPEMRRYSRRLSDLDILESLDLLRASFVGLEHTNDHKALKGSWSHVPEKPYVDFLIERLTACSALVCKMRERLESAYNHFALAMQTGAFVQLIILLVAVSSRMSVLSSELEEALGLGISTCNRLLLVIHPTGAQQLASQLAPPHSLHVDHGAPPEDAAQIILRCEPIDSSTVLDMKEEVTSEVRLTALSTRPTNVTGCTITQAPQNVSMKVTQKARVKKKKKLDEIDEIFGF